MNWSKNPSDCPPASWNWQAVDGGMLGFQRSTGANLLIRGRAADDLRRVAPRPVLQIGLLTPCNLSCHFCYRDTSAPSRLTAPFLLDLLRRSADWGVLEVAFGGGEPLLFRDFVGLVNQLHEQTPLGINFTTNGTLLTPEIVAGLEPAVGEIRLSAYPDNHYRRTLRLLAGRRVGVNWLVTPENVGMVEMYVRDFLSLGARNVLLLGYKGNDSSLHLGREDLNVLRRTIARLQHLPLRLDVCWYPHLQDLPHLFPRADCGAGDEFLVITPDRAVQACSFQHDRIPFETFDELRSIYEQLRATRPVARTLGCTRQQFNADRVRSDFTQPAVWHWEAHASNNSGNYTIVGRFQEVSRAQQAAEALRELARAHEAFLASPEGQEWLKAMDYWGNWPTPPLQEFGARYGFDWTSQDDGLWWEEDGCGAPVLTAGAVGDAVVVYHPYCMGLPPDPFRHFFSTVGATHFGFWDSDRPSVVVSASGNNPSAVQTLEDYLSLVAAAEYPSDVDAEPPWGNECHDPRVADDEDRGAQMALGPCTFQQQGQQLKLVLTFENTFAGAVAIENWLVEQGYADVQVAVADGLTDLEGAAAIVDPSAGLFPLASTLRDRIRTASDEHVVELLFKYYADVPAELMDAFQGIPVERRVELSRGQWAQRRQETDVTVQAVRIIQQAGPAAADWMQALWPELVDTKHAAIGLAVHALAASLPPDTAFKLASAWQQSAANHAERAGRLMSFGVLANPRTLDIIEQWWQAAESNAAIGPEWGRLAADSRWSWPTSRRWLEQGRPLSLIALSALEHHNHHGAPVDFLAPSESEFRSVLSDYAIRDPAPRATAAINRLLADPAKLTRT